MPAHFASANEISVNVAVLSPTESLPSPSPDHKATKPSRTRPEYPTTDTDTRRMEFTDIPLPETALTRALNSRTKRSTHLRCGHQLRRVAGDTLDRADVFHLQLQFAEQCGMKFKKFLHARPTTREPSRNSTVRRGGGFVSAASAQ